MELQVALSVWTLISQEAILIDNLNNYFKFDHNIFVMESSMDVDQIVRNCSQPITLFISQKAKGSVAGLEGVRQIISKNILMIVVMETSQLARNFKLLNQIQNIHRLHKNMKIGIFFQNITSMDDLRDHFLWFGHRLIQYVFATTRSADSLMSIFTFHPFDRFKVINVTISDSYRDVFPSLDVNYHRHTFLVAPFTSYVHEQFWLSVFQAMNATYTIEYVKYGTPMEYLQNGFDIVPRFAAFTKNASAFAMYPIMPAHANIVVPEAEPYSGFYAYLRMLTTNEFFIYSTAAIVSIIVLLSCCRYIKQKEFLFFQSLADILNLLINDNSNIKYRNLSRAEIFLIGPLTFVGFVVVNGYLSNLQSYFTKPFLQPQIKTLDDVYNSPIKIAIPAEWANVFTETVASLSIEKDWSNKTIALRRTTFRNNMMNLNTSTAYVMDELDFRMISSIQRQLNVRGFYDTGITVQDSFLIYYVSEALLFFDRLNEIGHWTHSSGLFHRWLVAANGKIEKSVLMYHRNRLQNQQTDDVGEIDFPMFISYGWIASTIVFIVEIGWTKLVQRCRVLRQFKL